MTRAVPASGWQNGGGYVRLEGAGFVRGTTVSIAGAATPARVINAGTILVQMPPGPIGPQDITIRAGGMSATLPRGFIYRAGGLERSYSCAMAPCSPSAAPKGA